MNSNHPSKHLPILFLIISVWLNHSLSVGQESVRRSPETVKTAQRIDTALQLRKHGHYVQQFEQKISDNPAATWKSETKISFVFDKKDSSKLLRAEAKRSRPSTYWRIVENDTIYDLDLSKESLTKGKLKSRRDHFGMLGLYGSVVELKLAFPKLLKDKQLKLSVKESKKNNEPVVTICFEGPKRIDCGDLIHTRDGQIWSHEFRFEGKDCVPVSWKIRFPSGSQTYSYKHLKDSIRKSYLPENWETTFNIRLRSEDKKREQKHLAKQVGRSVGDFPKELQPKIPFNKKRLTVLVFLFPGCKGVQSLSEVEKLSKNHQAELAVLDPHSNSSEPIRKFLGQRKLTNLTGHPGKSLANYLQIKSSPTFYLIHPSGKILSAQAIGWDKIQQELQKRFPLKR